ncbi:hypothetical protein ABKN59_002115 [Abortiporus biennis]
MSTVDDKNSRRRTFDVPTKPESGLAEWTTKIKALQRQVDEDEEAETRRLEQEIAASRLARIRRSTGASRGNSVDLSKNEIAVALKDIGSVVPAEEQATHGDRQINQDNALKALVGDRRVEHEQRSPASTSKGKPPSSPMSLAAFMGGKATGPRLTRHAPQQDSHDPTQFEQRDHTTTPHPVFGRGGVAMPGMTLKADQANGNDTDGRDRRKSIPHVVKAFVERVEEQRVLTAQKTGSINSDVGQYARQRTISTPTGAYASKTNIEKQKHDLPRPERSYTRPIAQSTTSAGDISARSATPHGRHTPNSLSPGPARQGNISPLPRSPILHTTPPHHAASSPPISHSPKPAQFGSPSLARPIQPDPRPPAKGPHIPASQSPSPAFLRPPPAKDPTPSISRLQGRGFVRNMVLASSQLEAESVVPISTGSPSRYGEDNNQSGRRPSSVKDRWQFDSNKSRTSPPIISPKPIPMRKSKTVDHSNVASSVTSSSPTPTYSPPSPNVIKADHTGKSLKSVASLPSISLPPMSSSNGRSSGSSSKAKSDIGVDHSPSASRYAVLGSSTTMISYIKPTKTGDNPPTSAPPSRPASRSSRKTTPEVDELGMKVLSKSRSRSRSRSVVSFAPDEHDHSHVGSRDAESGAPLSHPTKGRAKKPKKARETTKDAIVRENKVRHEEQYAHEPGAVNGHKARSTHAPTTIPVPPRAFAAQQSTSIAELPVPLKPTVLYGRVSPKPTKTKDLPPPLTPTILHGQASTKPQSDAPAQHVGGTGRRSPVVFPTADHEKTVPSERDFLDGPQTPRRPSVETKVLPTSPIHQDQLPQSPRTPRHVRIPSTGNRATVMDVARALSEHEKQTQKSPGEGDDLASSPVEEKPNQASQGVHNDNNGVEADIPPPDVKSMVKNWGPRQSNGVQPSSPQMEKRKSSYEKYSAFIMPPLEEERTPIQSPAGTLNLKRVEIHPITEIEVTAVDTVQEALRIVHHDEPLPKVDVEPYLKPTIIPYTPNPDIQTISVEVLLIVGNSATAVNKDSHIFYESEVLAIVHRSKAKSSGLVSTSFWSWQGKRAEITEKEDKKLHELARRYNTALIPTRQYQEPEEIVFHLGGWIAIRQGTRTHWTPENTSMHVVRCTNGVTCIDELDLNVRNLCSGYSYCLSLVGTFYVWYGSGSVPEERTTALTYARSMTLDPTSVIELTEGENDDDEMFWLMLGEREYANADYWKWRPSAAAAQPKIWKVESQTSSVLQSVQGISAVDSLHTSVYVVDCVWEYFVIVGRDARGKRLEIRLGLSVASDMSMKTSPSKPFKPTVHVLILPTQIPADLRLAFRDLDEVELNQGDVPDHMNLIPVHEAFEHLQRTEWDRRLLKDHTILPLGLDPSFRDIGHTSKFAFFALPNLS